MSTTTAVAEVDTPSTSKRVALRAAARAKIATVVFRDPSTGVSWGWHGNSVPPRMNLRTIDLDHFREHRVWLEDGGRRCFEPDGYVPSEVLAPLRKWLERRDNRDWFERRWAGFAVLKGWLTAHARGTGVKISVYPPDAPTHFVRKLDYSPAPVWLTDNDVRFDGWDLVVGPPEERRAQIIVPLPLVLWDGHRD